MSLDELSKLDRSARQNKQKEQKKSKPVKSNAKSVQKVAPNPSGVQRHTGNQGSSILSRLGEATKGAVVTIDGLLTSVKKSDIIELCETVGSVSSVSMKNDRASGRCTASCNFLSAATAEQFVRMYNGKTLDGVPMSVRLQSSGSSSSGLVQPTGNSYVVDSAKAKLFGSALGGSSRGGPTFAVTLKGSAGGEGGRGNRGGGRRREGGGGKSGGNNNRRGEREKRAPKEPLSKEALDAELDNWRSST